MSLPSKFNLQVFWPNTVLFISSLMIRSMNLLIKFNRIVDLIKLSRSDDFGRRERIIPCALDESIVVELTNKKKSFFFLSFWHWDSNFSTDEISDCVSFGICVRLIINVIYRECRRNFLQHELKCNRPQL